VYRDHITVEPLAPLGEGRLRTVASAIELLWLFERQDEVGVSEAAAKIGVAKSTAHRLLSTMLECQVLEQDDESRQYRLSGRVADLGEIAAESLCRRPRQGELP